ncbi:hypothetical protein GE061_007151 [Apolygus lucorum]|uniref:Uncharacterized protein n=1 Tax=Apolygus lucorum TaxID=248454 RepID=A0A6A4J3K0_APOLU|nr:hypothetical protein GE061_007151 [Apolygus lucorum]
MVSAFTNFSDWEDGAGLSADDLALVKKQFKILSKNGKVPPATKVLRAMVTYEGRHVKYIVAYEGDDQICSGRIVRKFNSKTCITSAMRVICQSNTDW